MSETDSKGVSRRKFIANKLAANGLITYAEINREYPEASRQQLKNDARILSNSGVDIEKATEGRNGLFFSPGSQFPASYEFRKNYNLRAKRRISMVAKYLAISKRLTSVSGVRDALSRRIICKYEDKKKKIIDLLLEHIKKEKRKMYLDGGTTTSQIAERLLDLDKLEYEEDTIYSTRIIEDRRKAQENRISDLEIWTNNRHVFYRLGHPKCIYRNIAIIGGYQLDRTAAICGETANEFASKLLPELDISFLGASRIVTNPIRVFMGNREESELKEKIMAKSFINIIVADSSKFSKYDDGQSFAVLDQSSGIDLIITNGRHDFEHPEIPILCIK